MPRRRPHKLADGTRPDRRDPRRPGWNGRSGSETGVLGRDDDDAERGAEHRSDAQGGTDEPSGHAAESSPLPVANAASTNEQTGQQQEGGASPSGQQAEPPTRPQTPVVSWGPGEDTPVVDYGLSPWEEQCLNGMAIRRGWFGGQRWATEACLADLQTIQGERPLTLKERAIVSTLQGLMNDDPRVAGMASKVAVAMESQNQRDDIAKLRVKVRDDIRSLHHHQHIHLSGTERISSIIDTLVAQAELQGIPIDDIIDQGGGGTAAEPSRTVEAERSRPAWRRRAACNAGD